MFWHKYQLRIRWNRVSIFEGGFNSSAVIFDIGEGKRTRMRSGSYQYRLFVSCLILTGMIVPLGSAFGVVSFSTRQALPPLMARPKRSTITTITHEDMLADTAEQIDPYSSCNDETNSFMSSSLAVAAAAAASTLYPATAMAEINMKSLQSGLTPENFQPVCGTSDGIYRLLQDTTAGLVGAENFAEYKPLIAGGLLRVRLELCVLESFFNEAVYPFVRDNGISWILPLHETVETFLAGGIFAVATTFILIGSTKILTVLVTYTDFLIGLPARLFGGFAFDRAQGKPVTLDIGFGPFKTRVVGPPDEEEQKKIDLTATSPAGIVILVVSGAVNYFGKALEVRYFHHAVSIILLSPHIDPLAVC